LMPASSKQGTWVIVVSLVRSWHQKTCWKTPREGYDEHNSKFSLSCETKVYRTSRRKNQTSEGRCPLALRYSGQWRQELVSV
jgi:hypothetical protein